MPPILLSKTDPFQVHEEEVRGKPTSGGTCMDTTTMKNENAKKGPVNGIEKKKKKLNFDA